MKLLYKAPLPFLGQKRNWIRFLPLFFQKSLLNDFNPNDYIFLDMFGGSGLLSHNLKQIMPNAEVVYNDYDYYTKFLTAESLEVMENLYNDLKKLLENYKRRNIEKIFAEDAKKITDLLKSYEKYKELLNIQQLKTWILHSAQCASNISFDGLIKRNCFYNRLPVDFIYKDNIENYLDGLIVEHLDFRELIEKYSTRNKKLFLICDPPYIATASGNYRNWFVLTDFFDLINILENYSFLIFSSDKSEFYNFISWINKKEYSKFKEIKLFKELKTSIGSGGRTYNDQMFYCYR